MSIEGEKRYVKERLEDSGFISVPFEINGSDIDPLFSKFRDYLDLCDEPGGDKFKDALSYTPPGRNAGGDYFVTRREIGKINPHSVNNAPATENKDVAHIGPFSKALAHTRLDGDVPKVMDEFLEDCLDLHAAAKKAVKPIFKILGLDKVMLAEREFDDQHVVRLLRYLGTEATHQAGLHFDRSAFTLAAWESRPGLVGAPGNNAQRQSLSIDELDIMADRANKTPVNHRSGYAKVFAGAGYNRLPDDIYPKNGRLPLLFHGVVNNEPGIERDAVVVFMHPPKGLKNYQVPFAHETGIDDMRGHILRRNPPAEDVA